MRLFWMVGKERVKGEDEVEEKDQTTNIAAMATATALQLMDVKDMVRCGEGATRCDLPCDQQLNGDSLWFRGTESDSSSYCLIVLSRGQCDAARR